MRGNLDEGDPNGLPGTYLNSAGQVDDHGDVLVARAGTSRDVLIDAHHPDALESVLVVDQRARD